jgi:hypothetical protein
VKRRIFGLKKNEMVGGWENCIMKSFTKYNYTDQVMEVEMAGHVAQMGEKRDAYGVLVEKSEGKRPLGRPRLRWERNIKMDLREIGWGVMDWIHMGQDRYQWMALVNKVMNLRVP